MLKKLYKVYMAIFNNKIIFMEGLYIITVNIDTSVYKIWYINEHKIPKLFDTCRDKDILKFKWRILMCKGEL